jgi:hypothetical protein
MSSGKTLTTDRGVDVRFLRVAGGDAEGGAEGGTDGGVAADSNDVVVEVDFRRVLGRALTPGAKEPSSSFAFRIPRD